MTPRLTTNCAKNYCNRTLIVKVILENVVTCFLLGHSVEEWSGCSYIQLKEMSQDREQWRRKTIEWSSAAANVIDDGRLVSE